MEDQQTEVSRLRAENQALREAHERNVFEQRMAEREREFRHRLLELELAGQGIPPVGVTPKAPAHGARAFVDALAGVDIELVIAAVKEIHERGYTIVEDFLTVEQVRRVRDGMGDLFAGAKSMFQHFDHAPYESHQTFHVQNVLAKTDAADDVAADPFLRAIVAGVLGYDFIFNAAAVAMAPDPGCSPQGLHRDDGFFALIPRPHLPLVLTVAIALDDFTAANGGTQVVPGSSRWPDSREPDPAEVIRCEMPTGSMLLWDGAIFHGGGGNRTETTRRTLTFNYTRGWLRTQFNQYLSVPRDRVLAMPPALQADLGYHRSALGLGGCDTQDPLKYLKRLVAAGGDGEQALLGREQEFSSEGG